MSVPTVSIITPAYNVAEYIASTIESVVKQTFPNWEMLIVDDASDDDTARRVEELSSGDERIVLLESARNQGAGAARNRALDRSRGRYVAFLDADDLWHPQKLERQLEFMAKSGAFFTYTAYEMLSADGERLRIVPAPNSTEYADLLKNTNIGCLTVILDTDVVGRVNMPNLPVRQPLVLWLRLLRTYGPAWGLDERLATYRVRAGSISRDKRRAAKGVWRVYREFENLTLPYALWCFAHYAMRGVLRNM